MRSVTGSAFRKGCFAVSLASLLFIFVKSSSAQDTWTKHAGPVLTPGAAGQWDDELVAPGTVIHQDTVYKMWYAGYDGTHLRVGYATSPDGISWTKHGDPVLNLGSSGTWDSDGAYLPNVYFNGTSYLMWYVGGKGGYEQTGYATSTDGITWTKYAGNPVMTPGASGKWDGYSLCPGPVVYDTAFHMIYNGFSDNNTCRSGYAASPDGAQWIKASDPVLNLGSWDTPRVQVNSVFYDSSTSKYLAFYAGGDIFAWRISYASATNLSGPWTRLGEKLLDVTSGAWDARFVGFPCVLYDSTDSLYKMWYLGGTADWKGSIGLATSATLTSVTAGSDNFPETFRLEQNYPNPFNPTTAISYKLSAISHVSLKVYDVLGREVRTLVNKKQSSGSYQVQFDASGLPSGVYFYRLKAGPNISVKKMLLLK